MPRPDLTRVREVAEATLTDECTISRRAGEPTLNTTTGATTPPAPSTIYTGACAVTFARQPRAVDEGGVTRIMQEYTVLLPTTATGIRPGDEIAVTSDEPTVNGLALVAIAVPERTGPVLQRVTATSAGKAAIV